MTSHRTSILVARTALFASVLMLAEVGPRAGWVDPLTFVPLSQIILQVVEWLADGSIWTFMGGTVMSILVAFVLSVVVGIVTGYLLWRYPWMHGAARPYMTSYYAIPIFAFYPALVSIFGLTRTPITVLAFAWGVVAVISHTAEAFDSVPVHLQKVARLYGLTSSQTMFRVLLPASAPLVLTGVRLAAIYTVIATIASEFILAPDGLGALVSNAYNGFAVTDMYAGIIAILLVTACVLGVVGLTSRVVNPYHGRRGSS